MNSNTAIDLYMRAVLRAGKLPFTVTNAAGGDEVIFKAKNDLEAMWAQSSANGNSKMTLGEINAEIAASRGTAQSLTDAAKNVYYTA